MGSENWAITLGRFDIQYATTCLARYNMASREGHLKAMRRGFGYLKQYPHGKIVVNTTKPDHSSLQGQEYHNWSEFYPDATEDIQMNLHKPKGKKVNMTIWVDVDHARDQATRHSVTAIMVLLMAL